MSTYSRRREINASLVFKYVSLFQEKKAISFQGFWSKIAREFPIPSEWTTAENNMWDSFSLIQGAFCTPANDTESTSVQPILPQRWRSCGPCEGKINANALEMLWRNNKELRSYTFSGKGIRWRGGPDIQVPWENCLRRRELAAYLVLRILLERAILNLRVIATVRVQSILPSLVEM